VKAAPIRPFWQYYGGKWRAVSRGLYPPPAHDVVIEPFAGAAGYGCHHPDRSVVLVEREPRVAAVWRWLIGATSSDVLALPPIIDRDVREYALPDAPTWLLGFWCGSALASPRQSPSKWRRQGGCKAWSPRIRARMAVDVLRIKRWLVIEGDYVVSPDVFAALGSWCCRRRGQVIVCEAAGADWLPFRPVGRMQAANTRGRGKTEEAVWLRETGSGPAPAQIELFAPAAA
jgi:hypothetical protein